MWLCCVECCGLTSCLHCHKLGNWMLTEMKIKLCFLCSIWFYIWINSLILSTNHNVINRLIIWNGDKAPICHDGSLFGKEPWLKSVVSLSCNVCWSLSRNWVQNESKRRHCTVRDFLKICWNWYHRNKRWRNPSLIFCTHSIIDIGLHL